jgi:hypothetical protein
MIQDRLLVVERIVISPAGKKVSKGFDNDKAVQTLKGKRDSYFKKHEDELMEYYIQGMPYLLVDEKFKLQEQVEAQGKEHESEWTKTRLEVLELKERNRELEEKLKEIAKGRPPLSREEVREMFKEEFRKMSGPLEKEGTFSSSKSLSKISSFTNHS